MNEQNKPKSTPKIIEKVAKHCGKKYGINPKTLRPPF